MCRPLGLAALLLALSPVLAQGGGNLPRMHVLMVCDTDDPRIGQSVKQDLFHLGGMFTINVPPDQLHMVKRSGNDVRPQRMLQAIGGLQVQKDLDTVVLYYSGHGGYDRDTSDHIYYPGRQTLASKEVREALLALKPRLIVIVADTCSTFKTSPAPTPMYPRAKHLSPLFKSLFFDPSGLIAVSSTSPGQAARGDSSGGYFTFKLVEYFGRNRAKTATWEETLKQVNQKVAASYADADQTAYVSVRIRGTSSPLDLETSAEEDYDYQSEESQGPATGEGAEDAAPAAGARGIRFGVTAEATARGSQFGGVEVTRVMQGYPGTSIVGRSDGRRYQLVTGRDIITHINQQPVTTYEEFRRAVAASPRRMTVRVYDTFTGASADYDVKLRGSRQADE